MALVRRKCVGQTSCTFTHADTQSFGDPCVPIGHRSLRNCLLGPALSVARWLADGQEDRGRLIHSLLTLASADERRVGLAAGAEG